MDFTITLAIIVITCLISIPAFKNGKMINDMIFYPAMMKGGKQMYRFATHGFLHADFMHLFFNMFTLYFFGDFIEKAFYIWSGNKLIFPLFYLTAIIFSSIPDYFKHKDNYHFRSLGASGGVSAVLFSFIIIAPWQMMQVWFIPMPAIVFAVLYVVYSIYMNKRGGDNINHGAHLYGAAYGVAFTLILNPTLVSKFVEQITHPSF